MLLTTLCGCFYKNIFFRTIGNKNFLIKLTHEWKVLEQLTHKDNYLRVFKKIMHFGIQEKLAYENFS